MPAIVLDPRLTAAPVGFGLEAGRAADVKVVSMDGTLSDSSTVRMPCRYRRQRGVLGSLGTSEKTPLLP